MYEVCVCAYSSYWIILSHPQSLFRPVNKSTRSHARICEITPKPKLSIIDAHSRLIYSCTCRALKSTLIVFSEVKTTPRKQTHLKHTHPRRTYFTTDTDEALSMMKKTRSTTEREYNITQRSSKRNMKIVPRNRCHGQDAR